MLQVTGGPTRATAEIQIKSTGWRYADVADLLGGWANRLDEETWALRARFPDYRQAPESERALQADALRMLEAAHAALRQADLACGKVAKALGASAAPHEPGPREEV